MVLFFSDCKRYGYAVLKIHCCQNHSHGTDSIVWWLNVELQRWEKFDEKYHIQLEEISLCHLPQFGFDPKNGFGICIAFAKTMCVSNLNILLCFKCRWMHLFHSQNLLQDTLNILFLACKILFWDVANPRHFHVFECVWGWILAHKF